MGRHFLIVAGFMLSLIICSPVSGQEPSAKAASEQEADSGGLPPITPSELDREPAPLDDDLPAPGRLPDPVDDLPEEEPAPATPPGKAGTKLVPPPRDEAVTKAGATLGDTPPVQPSAAGAIPHTGDPVPASNEGAVDGTGFVLSPDRLALGKQEVVLSVDVQAPQNLLFNRDATFKITVKNNGSTDALGVVVRDELPAGLTYVSAQPEAQKVSESLLSWRISTLPAGTERVILLKAKPTKAEGALDHAATVTFQAGSKATSRVLRPRLKLEVVQMPADGKVLRNKLAEFRIAVTNMGNGVARDVTVEAKLSPGLRYDSGERSDERVLKHPMESLAAGQRVELDPLQLDATQSGKQWCQVRVTSADVDFDKEACEVTREIDVVAPELKMTVGGHDMRYTDTVAPYSITLENPGTAPAKNVKVVATLGVSGRLVSVPPGAKYDTTSRRLQWTIPQIDPAGKQAVEFDVRMGGIGAYEVNVEAKGDNQLYVKDRRITDVQGMPDVELVVQESNRIVDVDGTTTFKIRLRNYGTKEATKLLVHAKLSGNLQVMETAGGPDTPASGSPTGDEITFPIINSLSPKKELTLSIKVKVTKSDPRLGTCQVSLTHDDLSQEEQLVDIASVKLMESRRAASTLNDSGKN